MGGNDGVSGSGEQHRRWSLFRAPSAATPPRATAHHEPVRLARLLEGQLRPRQRALRQLTQLRVELGGRPLLRRRVRQRLHDQLVDAFLSEVRAWVGAGAGKRPRAANEGAPRRTHQQHEAHDLFRRLHVV